jgi:hypothetical protein
MNHRIVLEIESVIDSFVEAFFKNGSFSQINTRALFISIRDSFCTYQNNRAIEKKFNFNVIYYAPMNYVKVLWRKIEKPSDIYNTEGEWIQIADHDSCWRDSWSEIYKNRQPIIEFYTKKGFIFDEVNEYVCIEKIEEINISRIIKENNNYENPFPKKITIKTIPGKQNYDMIYHD